MGAPRICISNKFQVVLILLLGEPLLWGPLPLDWAILGQSESFTTPVKNEFPSSENWLAYLLSEPHVPGWALPFPHLWGYNTCPGLRASLAEVLCSCSPLSPTPFPFSLWLTPTFSLPSLSFLLSLTSGWALNLIQGHSPSATPIPPGNLLATPTSQPSPLETSFCSLLSLRQFIAASTKAAIQSLPTLMSLPLLTLTGLNALKATNVWANFWRPSIILLPTFHYLLMVLFPDKELGSRQLLVKWQLQNMSGVGAGLTVNEPLHLEAFLTVTDPVSVEQHVKNGACGAPWRRHICSTVTTHPQWAVIELQSERNFPM